MGQLAVHAKLISREQCQSLRGYQSSRIKSGRPISFGRMLVAGGIASRDLRRLLRTGARLLAVRCDYCGCRVPQEDMPRRREYPCPECQTPMLPFAPFAKRAEPSVAEETQPFGQVLPLPGEGSEGGTFDERLVAPMPAPAEGTMHFRDVIALPGSQELSPRSEEETQFAFEDLLNADSGDDQPAVAGLRPKLSRSPASSAGVSQSAVGSGSAEDEPGLAFRQIGPFELERTLGEGSVGRVFLGRHSESGERAAIKVLRPASARDAEFLKRFEQEVRAASKLLSPYLVRVIEGGRDEALGLHYLGMEYLDCGSLGDLLEHTPVLTERRALEIGRDVCKALEVTSQAGIIHRDIKPHNVLLGRDGKAKLSDLGMAKDLGEETQITATGVVVGTPLYIAPEQATGKPVDHRTDLYSLGLCLYQMLTGKRPFAEDDAPALEIIVRHLQEDLQDPRLSNPQVGDGAAQVVRGLTAREPDQRYASAGAALRDFELVLAGHPPMGASDPTPASALAEPTVKMVLPAGKDGKPSLPPMAEETLPVAGPAPIAPQPLAPAGGSSPGTGRVLLWLLLALVVMGAAAAGIALALRKAAA